MASVRQATEQDIPALIALGRVMHAEAPALRHARFDGEKVEQALRHSVKQGCAFVHQGGDGEIDAVFVGLVIERWFSSDRFAVDLAIFVRPDRRGGLVAYRLIDAFITWCDENGIEDRQLGVTTGVAPDATGALYERLGFERIGGLYQMRINGHVHRG
jgi:GNAT superfamily N-acetyltransferase